MSAIVAGHSPGHLSKRFSWAGYLLDFGLGGFFDGIVLHQILQWHHLLTNVKSPFFQDIKNQILADGLFHVLMSLIAFAGLWKLWQARQEYAQTNADRLLLGNAFIDFGAWHILGSVLPYWIRGIHRVRMDSKKCAVLGFAVVRCLWYQLCRHWHGDTQENASAVRNTH